MDYTTKRTESKNGYIELQGRVFKISLKKNDIRLYKPERDPRNHPQEKRKGITEFSRKSRHRLLEKLNRIDKRAFGEAIKPRWITVTYPAEVGHKSWQEGKRDMRALWKRIERMFPKASAIWREEYQKRGEPHFHMVMFNAPISKEKLKQIWCEVIGYHHPNQQVDVQKISNFRQIIGYVSKYMAKIDNKETTRLIAAVELAPASGTADLDIKPKLAASKIIDGRVWGVRGEKNIPWAVKMIFKVVEMEVIHRLWRAVRKHPDYKRVVKRCKGAGLSIWSDNIDEWLRLAVTIKEGKCLIPQNI